MKKLLFSLNFTALSWKLPWCFLHGMTVAIFTAFHGQICFHGHAWFPPPYGDFHGHMAKGHSSLFFVIEWLPHVRSATQRYTALRSPHRLLRSATHPTRKSYAARRSAMQHYAAHMQRYAALRSTTQRYAALCSATQRYAALLSIAPHRTA